MTLILLESAFCCASISTLILLAGNPLNQTGCAPTRKKTIVPLLEQGARVVILGHQGRAGDDKYCELQEHAKILSRLAGKKIAYVHDLYGNKARDAITCLKEGQAILLRNVRNPSNAEEECAKATVAVHSQSRLVATLQPLFDYYINDAFSISHRAQASVVGFTGIPNIAGQVMEDEIKHVLLASKHSRKPYIAVLGGAKVEDYLAFMEYGARSGMVTAFLCTGLVGEAMLAADNIDLGAKMGFLRKKGLLLLVPALKKLLKKYPNRFILPKDLAVEHNGKRVEVDVSDLPSVDMSYDLGRKTAKEFADRILHAKTIYLKGPPCMFEKKFFSYGAKTIVQAVARATKQGAFSLCGGGESTEMIERFASLESISYASLSGGALIEFLAGAELPGLAALEKSYIRFRKLLH